MRGSEDPTATRERTDAEAAGELDPGFYRDQVRRGVELLDDRFAAYGADDWRHHVDAGALDMGHGATCVLGQVFGTYRSGVQLLSLPPGEPPSDYGFDLPPSHDMTHVQERYQALTRAWQAALTEV